jgi:DNA-binding protein H-NS
MRSRNNHESKSRQEALRKRAEKILAAKRAHGNWRATLSKHELAELHGVLFKKRQPKRRNGRSKEPPWSEIYIDDLLEKFAQRGPPFPKSNRNLKC